MEHLFQVNVFAVFWCMQAQIKAMLAQTIERKEDGEGEGKGGVKIRGRIVNISSTLGLHGFASNGVYAGTKHAVSSRLFCSTHFFPSLALQESFPT